MSEKLHLTNHVPYSFMLIVTGIFPVTCVIVLFVAGLETMWLTVPFFLASLIFYHDLITDHFIVIEIENQVITIKKPLLKYHLWKKKRNSELVIIPDNWDELSIGFMKNTRFYYFKKENEITYFFYAIGLETFEKVIRKYFSNKKVCIYANAKPIDELDKLKKRNPDSILN
ncbi:hypothetical protein [Fluviicola taffensis]|uniref:hypothetical protein n=1 Tax=Fluviicola taffensis TaxID=191579 RepID=UPI003137F017